MFQFCLASYPTHPQTGRNHINSVSSVPRPTLFQSHQLNRFSVRWFRLNKYTSTAATITQICDVHGLTGAVPETLGSVFACDTTLPSAPYTRREIDSQSKLLLGYYHIYNKTDHGNYPMPNLTGWTQAIAYNCQKKLILVSNT